MLCTLCTIDSQLAGLNWIYFFNRFLVLCSSSAIYLTYSLKFRSRSECNLNSIDCDLAFIWI